MNEEKETRNTKNIFCPNEPISVGDMVDLPEKYFGKKKFPRTGKVKGFNEDKKVEIEFANFPTENGETTAFYDLDDLCPHDFIGLGLK